MHRKTAQTGVRTVSFDGALPLPGKRPQPCNTPFSGRQKETVPVLAELRSPGVPCLGERKTGTAFRLFIQDECSIPGQEKDLDLPARSRDNTMHHARDGGMGQVRHNHGEQCGRCPPAWANVWSIHPVHPSFPPVSRGWVGERGGPTGPQRYHPSSPGSPGLMNHDPDTTSGAEVCLYENHSKYWIQFPGHASECMVSCKIWYKSHIFMVFNNFFCIFDTYFH